MGAMENFLPHELDVDKIDPDPDQPRKTMTGLEELSISIKSVGLIQPIAVRPHPTIPGRWMIVVGERRWRSAVMAGLTKILAFNRSDIGDDQIFWIQIIENLDDYRHPLEALEKALALRKFVESVTVEKACEILGKKKDWISRETALADVPEEIWGLAEKEKIKDRRTILDLGRLVKHTKRPVEDEWASIKSLGSTHTRDALHARMEASGAKKKRKKKGEGEVAGDEPEAQSDGGKNASSGTSFQITPGSGTSNAGHAISFSEGGKSQGAYNGGRFTRRGLNNKVRRAGKALGIDPDIEFEKFMEELLHRAVPEVANEEETAS